VVACPSFPTTYMLYLFRMRPPPMPCYAASFHYLSAIYLLSFPSIDWPFSIVRYVFCVFAIAFVCINHIASPTHQSNSPSFLTYVWFSTLRSVIFFFFFRVCDTRTFPVPFHCCFLPHVLCHLCGRSYRHFALK